MEEVLQTITEIVGEYESGAWQTPDKLRELQRSLSSNIYYLTKHQIEFNREWNRIYHESQGTNAAKEREADKQVPELYMCRKILEASKNVSISISNELSILKND